jgi:putative glutamine amidotransferase
VSGKPVIGVTRCSTLGDYLKSVELAGGVPRVLEFDERAGAVLEEVDAVLLTGGGDVDPVLYGETRHDTVQDAEPGRDDFELALARRALDADVPLLAICRGAQVLNVADGGTLVQDIPSAIATDLPHSVQEPKDCDAHGITVDEGSRLAQVLGRQRHNVCDCRVNSRHHQSVGRVGARLTVSARSDDGVVEAIENPAASFCIGVQWHPENFWQSGEFAPLFDAFVDAARAVRLENGRK